MQDHPTQCTLGGNRSEQARTGTYVDDVLRRGNRRRCDHDCCVHGRWQSGGGTVGKFTFGETHRIVAQHRLHRRCTRLADDHHAPISGDGCRNVGPSPNGF